MLLHRQPQLRTDQCCIWGSLIEIFREFHVQSLCFEQKLQLVHTVSHSLLNC